MDFCRIQSTVHMDGIDLQGSLLTPRGGRSARTRSCGSRGFQMTENSLGITLQNKVKIVYSLLPVSKVADGATYQVKVQSLFNRNVAQLAENLNLFRGEPAFH